ncbi:MAG: hypothetical protein KAT00_08855 [Planctomycetes bacterium]|nr:hypothetical protein [Planctomycetota bacterium]
MKEIDFIPEWYKTGKRRKVNYHRQYAVIGVVFLFMMVWSFATSRSISVARAQIAWTENFLSANSSVGAEYNSLQAELASLRGKTDVLEKLENRTDISSIIAELAFLTGNNIVLGSLDLHVEKFHDSTDDKAKQGVVLVGRSEKTDLIIEEDMILKVVVAGFAANASNVAQLISKLEDSSYFCRIIPGFSRTTEIKNSMITEFEISCYVANFVENKAKRI